MLIKIYPENPNEKQIREVAQILTDGGIIIYPTDTVYAIGCDINNKLGVAMIAQYKGVDQRKNNFSIICADLAQAAQYTKPISGPVFKLMKQNLPGPFTFILEANNQLPAHFKSKRKTIGIRIPDNPIPLMLAREIGRPIITTSIHDEDKMLEYSTDPELIDERFEGFADCIIDGGYGKLIPSTIIDCTENTIRIKRQGLGKIEI
ncbi:MAG: hypothetical protein RIS47_331 [Bacteroidota bacterium]|jgi:tRNA threonylcarbamoyl adenosine modification protein (Sua5/YciO/YrdC/YwlC family)